MTGEVGFPGFYSDEQWQAILSELPGKFDEQAFRTDIVHRALCLHLQLYAMLPSYEKDLRRIAGAARRLHKAITASAICLLIPALASEAKRLLELVNSANFAVHKVRKANNTDVERDTYLLELLLIWKSAGGEPKTSITLVDHRADGPLIRFLMAAAGPPLAATGRKLTAQAVRGFVRKARKNMAS